MFTSSGQIPAGESAFPDPQSQPYFSQSQNYQAPSYQGYQGHQSSPVPTKRNPSKPGCPGAKRACSNLFYGSTNAAIKILLISQVVVAILAVCQVYPGVQVGQTFLGVAGGVTILKGARGFVEGINKARSDRSCDSKIVKPIMYGLKGAAVGALMSVIPYVFGGLAAGGVLSGVTTGWVIIGIAATVFPFYACAKSIQGGYFTIRLGEAPGKTVAEKYRNMEGVYS